ncbi:MAG: hypothetical protein J0L71_01905 [Candidatus Accumulibacter sp.]|uniref:hypothetical protein n=1 Tax=Accumulibacter sp. TaxID=2053492 RepID=UPI001AD00F5E|nr:hypothetical protein [Accumulibacter sp.]MBN8516625.1 hypothetical protein [Accumulibacter sp.]
MNPSVFPIQNDDRPGAYQAETGMSLRDYFAAKAMQAFAQGLTGLGTVDRQQQDEALNLLAKFSWQTADAMLRTRDAG